MHACMYVCVLLAASASRDSLKQLHYMCHRHRDAAA
jgi:hypothetical protein